MENPCYKCGQTVEEGIPFCPHCSAPQIRVVVSRAPVAATAFDMAPTTAAAPSVISSSQTVPVLAVPMRWSQTVQPCALAALIAAVAMVLKLVVPLIAVVGAGFLAVGLYRRRSPEVGIGAGTGARLGALCGLFCFVLTTVLGALRVIILHEGGEILGAMRDALQQTAKAYSDPQFQQTLDFFRSPTGMVFMMVGMLIFLFLIFLLLATLGGAIGGATLSRRNRP
jgi:hypothetical protein